MFEPETPEEPVRIYNSKQLSKMYSNVHWFPFVDIWSSLSPERMFFNLIESPYVSLSSAPKAKYDLTSFPRQVSRQFLFPFRLPSYKFPIIFLTRDQNLYDYKNMNAITDYYTEEIRLTTSKRKFQKETPMEMWNKMRSKIISDALSMNPQVSPYEIRNIFFGLSKESNPFRPSIALAVYSTFKARRILDPCAGWGDRLIGAIAWNAVSKEMGIEFEKYHGVDPFIQLTESYKQMIDQLVPLYAPSGSSETEKFIIDSLPFESDKVLTEDDMEYYDLVFTSPPYYDFEEYALTDDRRNQSTVKYNSVQKWLDFFMVPMMCKCALALKVGGYLCINIESPILKPLFEKNLFLHVPEVEMIYSGVMGYKSDQARDNITHPIFVWYKNG